MMRRYRILAPLCFGLGLLALLDWAPQPIAAASSTSAPPLPPDMARVWILRQPNPTGGNVAAADPTVYVNGAPLSQVPQGTVFFHDFQPGTYRFTVQAYGTPDNLVDRLQLGPGTQSYVQVQAVPNWQVSSTAGGASFNVLTMAPQVAQPYFQTMTYLGRR
jgi:hypothetical protein